MSHSYAGAKTFQRNIFLFHHLIYPSPEIIGFYFHTYTILVIKKFVKKNLKKSLTIFKNQNNIVS